jgi:prepilin-type N-terminal cleavage/methylation domain-containing protein
MDARSVSANCGTWVITEKIAILRAISVNFFAPGGALSHRSPMFRDLQIRCRTAGSGPLAAPPRRAAFTLMELVVVIVIVAVLAGLVLSLVDASADDAEEIVTRATMQAVAEAITGSSVGPGYLADMKRDPAFPGVGLRMSHLLVQGEQPDFDAATRRGWRGPYLRNAAGVRNLVAARNGAFPDREDRRYFEDATFLERGFFLSRENNPYGEPGEAAVGDAWGNPIVLQIPPGEPEAFRYARLVSAGPDGVLATPLDRLGGWLVAEAGPERGDDLVLFLNRSDVYEP